jgi:glyoxylase-like metal-dependent hydrolase (beta-lactamase superfamily II)
MSAPEWSITAVRYGRLASTKARLFHRWAEYGEPDAPQDLAYYFYVLRSGGRTVVLDTGFAAASGIRRGRESLITPEVALAELGVAPGQVDLLVVSHLHYDHIGNLALFDSVPITAPATEIEFWSSPMAREPHFWSHVDGDDVARVLAAHAAGAVITTTGEAVVEPGIEAFEVGGHSPGQQVFLVQTAGAPVVLTSDAVHLYEELDQHRPFGVFSDLVGMYRGFDRVDELVGERSAVLVPGHDPLVAERFPALDGDGLLIQVA